MTVALRVLSRSWCHLCDDMIDLFMALAVSADVALVVEDVECSEAVEAQWGERVPVLFAADGEILSEYRLDLARVHAYLSQFPIKSAD